MKYIEKSSMTEYGVEAKCWIAINLSAVLFDSAPNPIRPIDPSKDRFSQPQPGNIFFMGWKDIDSLLAGNKPLDTKMLNVADVSALQSYPAMMTELITAIVSDPTSPMYGGDVKDIVVPPLSGEI
jgi:hypothetical protein